ncbi:response regulator [Paraburkholderia antibiotica]|uniref:Response regulator transcription factor n=1 Tax=Paraburkholderia antibiotica TaxID=2728839 RepID=A0A7X9ZZ28_9BURK|nr:response regulator transcription factor [Paraburkholderia antibiotica]NML32320.1 response regulator transcription factor [Paraburkholderia antibiotica]
MKILIVDDHSVVREGIAALLQRDGVDIAILQSGSAAEAFELIHAHADIDIVVLDLMLSGVVGLDAITQFAEIRPTLPVIVLSSSEDPRDVREAFARGALGYVPKSSSRQVLLSAIELVLHGDLYVPKLVLGNGSSERFVRSASQDENTPLLTQRQIEVLRRIGEGQPNKKIAAGLELSEKTVKAHITAIFKALKVMNRTQAVAAGRKAGLI